MSLLGQNYPVSGHVDIGVGAFRRLAEAVAAVDDSGEPQIAVIVSTGSGVKFKHEVEKLVPVQAFFELANGNVDATARIGEQLGAFTSVIALGGGRIIDAAKYAAGLAGKPLIAVATNLAHDGLASPVSILEHDGTRSSKGVPVPGAVIIDIEMVRTSPERFLRAGIGDVISNISALADWELARQINGEAINGVAATMARTAATSVAMHTGDIHNDDFLATLAEAVVLSGMAMAISGNTRPCSGACHEISHSIDELYPQKSAPHGEQVGVGALFASYLREDKSDFAEILQTLTHHNLPRTHRDLGLTDEEFALSVHHAPDTRPDRFTILEHLDMDLATITRVVAEFTAAV